VLLSAEMHNLIKMFRTDEIVQDYCPMYDQGKSGYWISEIKVFKIRITGQNVDLWRNCKRIIVVNSLKLRLRAKEGVCFKRYKLVGFQ
jgi:predicted component of viral defense system (DUF524 family)